MEKLKVATDDFDMYNVYDSDKNKSESSAKGSVDDNTTSISSRRELAVRAAEQLARIGKEETDSNGNLIRLRLAYSISMEPYAPDEMVKVPAALEKKGVTEEEWRKWRNILIGINKVRLGLHKKLFSDILSQLNPFNWFEDKSVSIWNKQLLRWQYEFNVQVLEPKGILCKTKSHSWSSQVPVYGENSDHVIDMRTERQYRREIHFSLTNDDHKSLRLEPFLTGEVYLREKFYVMHP